MPGEKKASDEQIVHDATEQVAINVDTFVQRNVDERSLDEMSTNSSALTEAAEGAADGTDDVDEWEEVADGTDSTVESITEPGRQRKVRKKRKMMRSDAEEFRLAGRRALCKRIEDIAPLMLKTAKLRILGRYLSSVRGLEDDDLTNVIRKDSQKLAEKVRIVSSMIEPDPNFDRGQLKSIIFAILLQEETHSVDETRLDEKVIEFEKEIVKKAKSLNLEDLRKQDPERWHHIDTYKIVLEAALQNDGSISADEARLLGVLRRHLSIAIDEHWSLSAALKKFPKEKCVLHTPDEVNEARKELQRDGVLWSYRDENNRNIDVIPFEIAEIIRREVAKQELQRTNYRRLLMNDAFTLTDLRSILQAKGLDRYGNKIELIERLSNSSVLPSEVLGSLDREKLSTMCSFFGLKSYGNKADLIASLIEFYDDLTFEERVTKDGREVWYSNFELLAARSYAELRAKKIISKDLEIERMFEDATEFLFQNRLRVSCERANKENRADGRLPLDGNQVILWDCKSVEGLVNLQDHLEGQFDGYLRKDAELGKNPLAFLVIGPAFTPHSLKLAYQYKARTNWDVALVTAEALKHLAERWATMEPNKAFPIRLLNRTELIDKERAEFLLSLA